jgi:hypothetical protein
MRYFHTCDDGPRIVECGFRDSDDVQVGDRVARGVLLCDRVEPALSANESVVEVDLPAEIAARFAVATEDLRDGHILLVPASIANRYRIVNFVS